MLTNVFTPPHKCMLSLVSYITWWNYWN